MLKILFHFAPVERNYKIPVVMVDIEYVCVLRCAASLKASLGAPREA